MMRQELCEFAWHRVYANDLQMATVGEAGGVSEPSRTPVWHGRSALAEQVLAGLVVHLGPRLGVHRHATRDRGPGLDRGEPAHDVREVELCLEQAVARRDHPRERRDVGDRVRTGDELAALEPGVEHAK